MTQDLTPETGRWTAHLKEQIVIDIRKGRLSQTDACERYDLSAEELSYWLAGYTDGGRDGLKVTKLQTIKHGDPD